MDWERTLNILTIAFLTLCLVFATQLWLLPALWDPDNCISSEQIDATLQKLEQLGISTTVKVPKRLGRVQALEVSREFGGEERLAAQLIGAEHEKIVLDLGMKYHTPQGEVIFYEKGGFYYRSLLPVDGGARVSVAEAARKQADRFLRSAVGMPKHAVAGRTVPKGDGAWAVEYVQRWRRNRLSPSKIVITVDKNGAVLEMLYYWLKVAGLVGETLLSIPSTTALVVAASEMPPGTTIADIYLSWYTPPVLASQWSASPVWVVETDDGKSYYINACDGQLEGEDDLSAGEIPTVLNKTYNINRWG